MLSLAEARRVAGQRRVVAYVPKQRIAGNGLDLGQVVTVRLIDRRLFLFLLLFGVRGWAIHAVTMIVAAAFPRRQMICLVCLRERTGRSRGHRAERPHRQTQREGADDKETQRLKGSNHGTVFNHTSATRDSSPQAFFAPMPFCDTRMRSPPIFAHPTFKGQEEACAFAHT